MMYLYGIMRLTRHRTSSGSLATSSCVLTPLSTESSEKGGLDLIEMSNGKNKSTNPPPISESSEKDGTIGKRLEQQLQSLLKERQAWEKDQQSWLTEKQMWMMEKQRLVIPSRTSI